MDFEQKKQLSEKLRDELADASALVLVQFSGLTVEDADDLRTQFRDAGCVYHVYKNSTIRFAVAETSHEPLTGLLKGVSGLAYNVDDPGAPARVARDFAKKNDKLQIKGGVMEGKALDEAGVRQLADLPGPLELKAQLLSLFAAPSTQMVRVLNAPTQNLLNVLTAKKDKDAA